MISFGHLWVVELAYMYIKNFFKFILSCQQFDNCSYCLPPVANLPPVSLIPVAISPASLTPVAILPPVSTTLAKMVGKFGGAP